MGSIFLLRYDTETQDGDGMRGFLETVVAVHRAEAIPATFFCTGGMLDARLSEFRDFAAETAGDPLFDMQDHSYSHIGVGFCARSEPGPRQALCRRRASRRIPIENPF